MPCIIVFELHQFQVIQAALQMVTVPSTTKLFHTQQAFKGTLNLKRHALLHKCMQTLSTLQVQLQSACTYNLCHAVPQHHQHVSQVKFCFCVHVCSQGTCVPILPILEIKIKMSPLLHTLKHHHSLLVRDGCALTA